MTLIEQIDRIFSKRGAGAYFGERVSMTEHSLQTAFFAQAEHAPTALVLAALLHDVGHLIDNVPDDLGEWTSDAHHEELGSRWLATRFKPDVFEPVRLHVPAKRYLCATDRAYFAQLSPASVVTLKLQGGPMSVLEIGRFEQEPFHRDAIRLRRWDDRGKVAGLVTPSLAEYGPLIEGLSA